MSPTALVTRPYSGPEDDSLPDSVKKLPQHGREIFAAAFNSAWDSYDPDESEQDSQEAYAMAVAWAAVKKVYKQNEDGEWVERSFVLGSYEGMLTRVADRDGVITWRTTCSDDGVDVYATRMTTDLHDDFIRRAATRGMPFLTIAHYNQIARIGRATKLYRDGRRLKAEGVFFTTEEISRQNGQEPDGLTLRLARAAAETALQEQNVLPRLRKVRTSIGFKPLGAASEDLGVLAYTKGYLPEITMTSHPGNSRVDFGAQQRSGDMQTRISPEFMQFDASTIVGEELAAELDKRLRKMVGESRSTGDDPAELLYRSLETLEELDVAALDETGLIAASRRSGLSDAQKEQIEQRFEEIKRPAPWKRDAKSLSDRLLDVLELQELHAKGLVDEAAVKRATEEIAEAFIGGTIEEADGVTFAAQDGKLLMRSEHGEVAFSGRAGRRLQSKQLKSLEDALQRISGASEAITAIVSWAKEATDEGGDGEGRSYEPQTVEPAQKFHELLLQRMNGHGPDPDQGLIETMEYQEMIGVVMNATYTLADIIMANLTPDNELAVDDRMSNIEAATGEYLQVINAIIMQTYGGGRSAGTLGADYSHVEGKRNAKDRTGVKPEGAAAGAVNPAGTPAGEPDLSRFDEVVSKTRQLVIQGASPQELQEALNDMAGAIEEALPEPEQSPQVDALAERVGGIEMSMSQVLAVLEELKERGGGGGGDPEPLTRRTDLQPRRRSMAPGPRRGATPEPEPAPRDGPLTLREIVSRSTRQPTRFY